MPVAGRRWSATFRKANRLIPDDINYLQGELCPMELQLEVEGVSGLAGGATR